MPLQLEVSRQAPAGNLADNISGFMSDTLSVIRHKNARKILSQHCDGVIRRFSEALGKGEQQCSNFLRIKNPVKIGNKIAREIEFAFGYPNKWLDLDEHQDQEDAKYVNSDILASFITIEEEVKKLASASLDGLPVQEALRARSRLSQAIKKQTKLMRHISYDIEEQLIKQLYVALDALNIPLVDNEEIRGPKSMYAAIAQQGIGFRVCVGNAGFYGYQFAASYRRHFSDSITEEYECHPILIDNELALVFLFCPEQKADIRGLKDYDIHKLIINNYEFTADELPGEIVPYINQHPDLNSKSNKI